MPAEPPASPGFLGSIRALGDGLLAGVQDRIELIGCELREEKHRLIRTCFWIAAIVATGIMAVSFASIALVYLFWERDRLGVLIGLALAYAAAFATISLAFRRRLKRQPQAFASVLGEIERDRACLRDES